MISAVKQFVLAALAMAPREQLVDSVPRVKGKVQFP